MIGLPVRGTDLPGYLVRNIIGVDPQAGGIAIGAMVEEGDSLFFCRRDVESAGRDMDRMLADLKRRCGDQTPRGALWFSCMARCQDQFVQTPGELSRIQTVFPDLRSEEHTSELQSLMRISYAVFCLKKKQQKFIIFV